MTLFELLLITHLVMDWIFQQEWEAKNKSKKWPPLLHHCFKYTLGFVPVFLLYKINFLWLGFILLSHIILDQRKAEIWLLRKFKGLKKEETAEFRCFVLLIGVDQTLHLLVLAIVSLFN